MPLTPSHAYLALIAACVLLAAWAAWRKLSPRVARRLRAVLRAAAGKTDNPWDTLPAPVMPEKATETLEAAMGRLQIHFDRIEGEGEGIAYHFIYQSGFFVLDIPAPGGMQRLTMPGVYTAEICDIDSVRLVCNQTNEGLTAIKAIYSFDEDGDEIRCHLQCALAPAADTEQSARDLSRALGELFSARDAISPQLHRVIGKSREHNISDIEHEYHCDTAVASVLARAETLHSEDDINRMCEAALPVIPPAAPTVGDWLRTMGLLAGATLLRLRVVTGQDVRLFEGDGAARHYQLHTALSSQKPSPGSEGHALSRNATLLLSYRLPGEEENTDAPERQLTLVLEETDGGEDGTPLRYRLTYSMPPKDAQRPYTSGAPEERTHPLSGCMAMSADMRTLAQAAAEFRYELAEAREAADKGEALTPVQSEILAVEDTGTAYDIYWGQKLMLEKDYFNAALHFQRCWQRLNTEMMRTPGDKLTDTYHNVSYRAGFCLMELGLPREAFYYLQACEYSGDASHMTEMVNCLVNAGDYRAVQKVDSVLATVEERVKDITEEDGNVPPELGRLRNFLRRRRVYLFIERGHIDQAERDCHAMLDEPANADFALNELDYIQRLRDSREAQPGGETGSAR